jgi:hypothetical protein
MSKFKRIEEFLRRRAAFDFEEGLPITAFYDVDLRHFGEQHRECFKAAYEIGWRCAKERTPTLNVNGGPQTVMYSRNLVREIARSNGAPINKVSEWLKTGLKVHDGKGNTYQLSSAVKQ